MSSLTYREISLARAYFNAGKLPSLQRLGKSSLLWALDQVVTDEFDHSLPVKTLAPLLRECFESGSRICVPDEDSATFVEPIASRKRAPESSPSEIMSSVSGKPSPVKVLKQQSEYSAGEHYTSPIQHPGESRAEYNKRVDLARLQAMLGADKTNRARAVKRFEEEKLHYDGARRDLETVPTDVNEIIVLVRERDDTFISELKRTLDSILIMRQHHGKVVSMSETLDGYDRDITKKILDVATLEKEIAILQTAGDKPMLDVTGVRVDVV